MPASQSDMSRPVFPAAHNKLGIEMVQAVEDRMGKEGNTNRRRRSPWVATEWMMRSAVPRCPMHAGTPRLCRFVKDMSRDVGSSIPTASGNFADIKASYRMLANPWVGDQEILSVHLQVSGAEYRPH